MADRHSAPAAEKQPHRPTELPGSCSAPPWVCALWHRGTEADAVSRDAIGTHALTAGPPTRRAFNATIQAQAQFRAAVDRFEPDGADHHCCLGPGRRGLMLRPWSDVRAECDKPLLYFASDCHRWEVERRALIWPDVAHLPTADWSVTCRRVPGGQHARQMFHRVSEGARGPFASRPVVSRIFRQEPLLVDGRGTGHASYLVLRSGRAGAPNGADQLAVLDEGDSSP